MSKLERVRAASSRVLADIGISVACLTLLLTVKAPVALGFSYWWSAPVSLVGFVVFGELLRTVFVGAICGTRSRRWP